MREFQNRIQRAMASCLDFNPPPKALTLSLSVVGVGGERTVLDQNNADITDSCSHYCCHGTTQKAALYVSKFPFSHSLYAIPTLVSIPIFVHNLMLESFGLFLFSVLPDWHGKQCNWSLSMLS